MKQYFIKIIAFVSLFSVLFFIASRDKEAYTTGSWRSSLFVDPAGYNVYLPSTFQHSFIHNFPDKTDSLVAYGFMVNKDKKVITKFTYGIALLQSPFYIAGLGISKVLGIENTGYSYFNQVLIDVIGIFYACLGLFFLYALLRKFYSRSISSISVLVVFIGTNTFYYASIQPGMSHIYSFFLVNISLYCLVNYIDKPSAKKFWLLSFLLSVIVLIRPINIILLLPVLVFNTEGVDHLRQRLRSVFQFRNIIIFLTTLFLVFIPQFIYWKFTYGSFIADSYPGEGFTFLKHPQIKELLFSPHNGLLAYSPLYLVLFVCILFLFKKYKVMAWSLVITFSLLIYLSASWYLFFFGCGFGGRNFVEYSGLLAFPLAFYIQNYFKKLQGSILAILICICVFINLKLMYSWDLCYWGSNDWAWKEYKYLLWKPHKHLTQNLDSLSPAKIGTIDNEKAYSVTENEEYCPGFEFRQSHYTRSYFKSAKISVDVFCKDSVATPQLVCMGFDKDSVVFYKGVIIPCLPQKWTHQVLFSPLSHSQDKDFLIKIFVMNKDRQRFAFKNLKVELE